MINLFFSPNLFKKYSVIFDIQIKNEIFDEKLIKIIFKIKLLFATGNR